MLDEPENKVIMYHKGMQWTSLNIFWNTLFMHMKIKTKSKIAALSYELYLYLLLFKDWNKS